MPATRVVPDSAAIINNAIHRYLKDGYPPAISVAFYCADSHPQELTAAEGTANYALNLEATPDVIFELGSVTKVFTATLLAFNPDMLDDPLSKHLSHLPFRVSNPSLDQVTLKMLGTHTSGFPRNAPSNAGPGESGGVYLFHDKAPAPDSALVQLWRQWTPDGRKDNYCSVCAPGTCWQYSNVGFVTLGYAVAGTSYNSMLRDNVTGPLKMNATCAQIPDGARAALGYDKRLKAAGGELEDLKSSGNDMLTWIKANLGVIPLPKPLSDAMGVAHKTWFERSQQSKQPHVPPINFDMGLAWQKRPLTNSKFLMWAKDGAGAKSCQTCWTAFIPEKKTGIAVLTNGAGAAQSPAALGIEILQQVLGLPTD